MAPSTKPPHQHSAETNPALRGPTRSSQPPQIAAAAPSSTKNSVYIQPRLATFQLQVVVNSSVARLMPSQTSFDAGLTRACDNGNQNTLKP